MSFKIEGDDIRYETSKNQIIIYVDKIDGTFVESHKCFATHYLKQTLDDDGVVIKEIIRKNPHKTNFKFPEGYGVLFD